MKVFNEDNMMWLGICLAFFVPGIMMILLGKSAFDTETDLVIKWIYLVFYIGIGVFLVSVSIWVVIDSIKQAIKKVD